MPSHRLIAGIDIGNSQVKVVISKVTRENLCPEIVGVGSAPSQGLRRGMVVDMEETLRSIRTATGQAQEASSERIKRAYLSVSGQHINTQTSRGVIAVSRADSEISQNDIDRVIQAASVVSLPPNREIIDVIPRNFIVDGTDSIKNPLGMKGVRLEAEVFIIDGLSPHLRNLAKCVNECNIEVAGLVYAPLVATYSALDKNQKEYGVMHLDFGGGTSSLAVFEEADLVYATVLPVGSRHITNDLAIALRTSLDIAEQIKLEHAITSQGDSMRSRGNIDLSEYLDEENFLYPRKQLVRVVDARVHELLDLVRTELKKVSHSGRLPAGVVLSGGGSNLPGFALVIKDVLKLPVRIGKPFHVDDHSEMAADPSYMVAVGLVLWGFEHEFGKALQKGGVFPIASDGLIFRILQWLKNFMP